MRGSDEMQEALFTFSRLEDFVPADHPLRSVKKLVDESLQRLNGLFNTIYAARSTGARPGTPVTRSAK